MSGISECPNCGYEKMEWEYCSDTGHYGDCFKCGYFETNVTKTGIIDKEEYKMRYEYLEEWVKDEPEKYKDDFITYQSNCLNLPDEVKTIKINKW